MTDLRLQKILRTPAGPGAVDAPVQHFAAELEASASPEAAWRAICAACLAAGIDFVIYMYMRPGAPHDNALIRSNLPSWWTDYYQEERYAERDPFFKACRSFAPTRTGPAYVDDHTDILTEEERQFVREGGETGLTSGVASPVRLVNPGHYGGWNFGTRFRRPAFETYIAAHWERLQLMGFIAHEALQQRAQAARRPVGGTALSARERECLLWLSRGLRTAEIASRLGLAPVTVELHFRRARTRLGAATRQEALAKAIVSGEIVP